MKTEIHSLSGRKQGVYIVETLSGSAYLVNLNKNTLERIVEVPDGMEAASEVGADKKYGRYNDNQSVLPADNTPNPLITLECAVGQSARFCVSGMTYDPEMVTNLTTTRVVRILNHS